MQQAHEWSTSLKNDRSHRDALQQHSSQRGIRTPLLGRSKTGRGPEDLSPVLKHGRDSLTDAASSPFNASVCTHPLLECRRPVSVFFIPKPRNSGILLITLTSCNLQLRKCTVPRIATSPVSMLDCFFRLVCKSNWFTLDAVISLVYHFTTSLGASAKSVRRDFLGFSFTLGS